MDPITNITGKVVAVPLENIDTDQIIPAKWLKVTDKSGLGDGLFETWRYNADGSPNPDFVLNKPEAQGASILVAGKNFGSGSSREHAPWALQAYGFKAVIAPAFADIFRGNSLKIGLLPVIVDEETFHQLVSLCEEDPTTEVSIDLAQQSLSLPGGQQVNFPIDGFSKHCLLNGVDQLGFIMQQESDIVAYEAQNPVLINTQA
ncbi:3-isopropylmalate dehydratase small subunit [Candidatus Oscillochloris fontis]|uniref:3-isopropylmalate dehydratase small subunit n=1 Tax=Candidatus Oscillochloris fontis TaxID=2496868 RepID=UPI00101E1A70|nr:3-isopropylmalate dehydratase small subunit [Candidatus Oscillochloris fontis]